MDAEAMVEKTLGGIKIDKEFDDVDLIELVDKWARLIEFVRRARVAVVVNLGDIEVIIKPTDDGTAQ